MNLLESCPLCRGPLQGGREVRTFEQPTPGGGPALVTTLVECPNCSHVFSNPQPTWDEVAPFYGGDTWYKEHLLDESKVDELIASKYDGERFNHIPVVPGGRYLDVGSGPGYLVAGMARLGMDAHGVEPRKDAVAVCRNAGLKVQEGTLEEAAFPDDHFDCISMSHVLEHVPDPVALLKECRRVMKPGGTLVVAVPNYRSLVFGLVGWSWLGIDTPRHLHQFTDAGLRRAGAGAGLAVKAIETESLPNFVEVELATWLRRRAFVPHRLTMKTRAAYPLAKVLSGRGNATGRGEALIAHMVKEA